MRLVVITGCSGGGKSALVDELSSRGHSIVEEPGRRVIAAELVAGGRGFPWDDALRFSTLVYWMAVGDHGTATDDPTFFDRSVLDQCAWFLRKGHPLPGPMPSYHPTVFVAPPWPEIYRVDEARRHDFNDAVVEFEDLMQRLPEWGYDCRLLPKRSVSERADWVLSLIHI